MKTKCLIVDFSDCTYSIKELTDEQIAENDAYIFRINDGQFEENIYSSQTKDRGENTISTRLLWTLVDATREDRDAQLKAFRNPDPTGDRIQENH